MVTGSPWLRLSPSTGPPTGAFRVSGGGFGASESVDVYFGNTDEALAATDAHGYFVPVKLHVPAAAVPGMHWVSAKGRTSGRSARRHFTVATSWDQFGRVPSHTHANPYENLLSPRNVSGLTQVWNYATGSTVSSSPAVVHGVVYAGSYDHNVYALNAKTGAKLWSFATGGAVYCSPAVVHGVVYVGSFDHNVYALNAKTGAKLWSHRTGGGIMSSPAVADGVVYIGGGAHVYALNARTGAKLWSYSTGPAAYSRPDRGRQRRFPGYDVYSSPAVSHGVVYVSANNSVYAFGLPAKPAALAGRVSRPRQRSGKDHAPRARTAASRTPTRDHRPARSRQSRR